MNHTPLARRHCCARGPTTQSRSTVTLHGLITHGRQKHPSSEATPASNSVQVQTLRGCARVCFPASASACSELASKLVQNSRWWEARVCWLRCSSACRLVARRGCTHTLSQGALDFCASFVLFPGREGRESRARVRGVALKLRHRQQTHQPLFNSL